MYFKKLNDVFAELSVTANGLTSAEALTRQQKYGLNVLKAKKAISPLEIFVAQFKSFVVGILLVAVLISLFLGEYLDSAVIGAILILNAVLGFVQEYRAGKAIEALKKLGSIKAKVLRDGKEVEVDASELVPGDVLIIEEGDKINADSRLIEVISLETQEAALTGESTPVEKSECVVKEGSGLGDQKNMLFAGTVVTKGRGKAIVISTGMNSQIGKIAKLIGDAEEQLTPLQKKLQDLGSHLGVLTIIICIIVFAAGAIRTGEIATMFLAAVALAVAAIPEGLPIVVTICMSLGVQKMVKKNALIRKLSSVETLGSTTVICSDKTGTLTHNEMTVRKLYANGDILDITGDGYEFAGEFLKAGKKLDDKNLKNIELLLRSGILCNNAEITQDQSKEANNQNSVIGDPTEGALIVSAEKIGLHKQELNVKFARVKELPFDSKRKLMTTVHKTEKAGSFISFTKGAPDVIIDQCTKIYVDGKIKKLDAKLKSKILASNELFAQNALRVLGFAFKQFRDGKTINKLGEKELEKDLVFLGLQGMIDPPRQEAKLAIEKCKTAGIKVIMITGDHRITAEAIGRELGLQGQVMTGEEIEKCADLSKVVEGISIFARVSPEHKMKIVDALRKNGEVIAMTGDGVNDAPALKDADIGIAMGITGTDVAKEASAMILMDDNFASIVNAVEEGRNIYDNIKKFVNYLLSANFGEVLVLFMAMLIGFKDGGYIVVPLVAIQILWLNLVTDGLPALALGLDPETPGTMQRPPRKPNEQIISKNMTWNIVATGILMCIAVLAMFKYGLATSAVKGQTMAFTSLVMLEMVRVYMVRANYNLGFFSNKYLVGAIVLSLMLHLSVVYIPFLQPIFDTVGLNLIDWLFIVLASMLVLIVGVIAHKIIVHYTQEHD
ncbi:TPA: calcium-translocating P-type ATPase, SERCA-type [Candidatus Woesearchaeota archaeon]|nr:calcium-translocating P-type ATPase, SERCA-type [Candidatus Woesearchaeota archaeon]